MTKTIFQVENISGEDLKIMIQQAVQSGLSGLPVKKETRYLTRGEVAQKLHLSLPTVDRAITEGRLKAYRIGGRVLLREDEINLEQIPKRKHHRL